MNYVEEFFISIGFDTAKVKKESKEIDKILDGIVKKKRSTVSDEVKLKRKLHKQNKASETDNFKHFLNLENAKRKALNKTQEARRKQAVGNLTAGSGNRITSKNTMFSPLKEVKVVEKVKDDSQRKRFIRRKKHRAELARQRIKEEDKANLMAKKALQQRLTAYKAARKSQGIDKVGARKLHDKVQKSPAYMRASSEGTLGSVGTLMDKAAMSGNIDELRRLQHQLRKTTVATRKLNVAQKGLVDSTRNMIRSYASVFAMFQGTIAIKRIGQDFQGMSASMLAASGSSQAAAKDFQFVNDMSQEMGLNLRDTTDAFVKFKFAAKGKMDDNQIQDILRSINMFGTALKIGSEDQKRAMRALQQMMSKGKIMAEELKNQLGDALPASIQIFAKALNMTEAELFKAMEQGQLFSSDVLPKVAEEFKKAALAGGAYSLALKGLRVTEGQMVKSSQEAGDLIFKSGFSAGLADLYKTLADVLKNSGPQLEKLGKIFGSVFKGLAYSLRLVEPIMRLFIDNFEIMFGAYAIKSMATFATAANLSLARAFLPITAAVAAAEELISLMSDDLVGVTESSAGKQFNILTGNVSGLDNKEGKYYKASESKKVIDTSGVLSNTMKHGIVQAAILEGTRMLSGSNAVQTTTTTQSVGKVEVNFTGIPLDMAGELQNAVNSAFAPNSG